MSVKITGAREVADELRSLTDFLSSTKPMEGCVNEVKEGVLDKTARGLDYRGQRFEKLSPAYAKRKQKAGGSGKADMRLSGEMMDSVVGEVISPTRGVVKIGSTIRQVIANIHNTGTGKMPQREFMNITKSGLAKIIKKHYDDPILEIARRMRRK